ncbi:MAG TPA: PHP domain-containing protein, partial [Polyangiaceae bacterium]|nr:PHP domain-containing protein [Polyangiaceae bacterium]
MFAELLIRSCFSFLRAAARPQELMREAARLGLTAVAQADLDGLYGLVRASQAAQEHGLSFIVAVEITLANDPNLPSGQAPIPQEGQALTLALFAQDAEGYQNICRLLTLGHEHQEKGSCVCEAEWLSAHNAGLYAALISPADPRRIQLRRYDEQLSQLTSLIKAAFGERCAVITYRHLDGLDKLRDQWAIKCADLLGGAPIVASARALYHQPARKALLDVLTCIRLGISLDEAGALLSPNAEQCLRSEAQMRKLFADHLDWVEQSAHIAERCKFSIKQLAYHFPCELLPGQTADERLAELSWAGAARRYPQGISDEVRSQVNKELCLIKKIGVAPYFLCTQQIVEMARRRKILCQGRGSAANSAVCYLLGITAVDPSRSQLLFERFLSEERAEPPDIDIDFEHERREEVIQEIYEKYGRDRAAMVAEIISYRSKSALREVARVFGLSEEQADRLSGAVVWYQEPEMFEKRLMEAGFDLKDARIAQVVTLAQELCGFPRHLSIHVGGFVLSARPLCEVAPVEPAKMPGRTVVPWDKDDIDALGFFKVDVLGLGMLTAIRKTLELLHRDAALP